MNQTSQNLKFKISFKCYIINDQNQKNQPNLLTITHTVIKGGVPLGLSGYTDISCAMWELSFFQMLLPHTTKSFTKKTINVLIFFMPHLCPSLHFSTFLSFVLLTFHSTIFFLNKDNNVLIFLKLSSMSMFLSHQMNNIEH